MENNKIKKINKKHLLNINSFLENIDLEDKDKMPISVTVKFHSYFDLVTTQNSLLTAIQKIVLSSDQENIDLDIINDLTKLALAFLQSDEAEFLDKLLIEQSFNTEDFVNLEKL